MPLVSKEQVLSRLRTDARNSSHFVWLLADLQYYECQNRFLFAYTKRGSVTLLALEPLIPNQGEAFGERDYDAFKLAWSEFKKAAEVEIAAFVSVYEPFKRWLEREGFMTLKVGEEPWVLLSDCIPTGNAGKGVRSARNQAIRAGILVEEWKAEDIKKDTHKQETLRSIYREWKLSRPLDLSGFMNATDPLAYTEERRYFVLKHKENISAFLIASPVAGIKSYFLEDLVQSSHCPRGTGEILTLEAMVALRESQTQEASLGVVAATTVDVSSAKSLPAPIRFLLLTVPKVIRTFYNFDGMGIYRRRFKPHRWSAIYLAVKPENTNTTNTLAWVKSLLALGLAFKPRPNISLHWMKNTATRFLQRYAITSAVASVSLFVFAYFNRFGNLDEHYLKSYGFYIGAPLKEWFYRTFTSDFLYFDASHFYLWGTAFFLTLAWAERTHSRRFVLTLLFFGFFLDDFINYLFILKPFDFYQPHIFKEIIEYKDVGSSLVLMVLVGLQLCQLRAAREVLFAVITFGLVLKFALDAAYMKWFVVNLNHVLFLVLGYIVGKLEFNYIRKASREVSKMKPPESRTVLQPSPVDKRTNSAHRKTG